MERSLEPEMDVFSSEEAPDTQRAYYYKDEMKYFVSAVTKAVVERHLVEPRPDLVLSPVAVTKMAEREVAFVAAEPADITQQCAHLDSKKKRHVGQGSGDVQGSDGWWFEALGYGRTWTMILSHCCWCSLSG